MTVIIILFVVSCFICGCISTTTRSPPLSGPPPVIPGGPVTDYGGSAIAISFKTDEISTSSPEAKELFIRGLTNLTQYGRYNESLTYFDAALAIDPDFTEAWIAEGVALHNLKRYDAAIACYNKSLEILGSPDAGTWHLKGMAFRDWGRNEEAAECNRRAAELDPRYGNG